MLVSHEHMIGLYLTSSGINIDMGWCLEFWLRADLNRHLPLQFEDIARQVRWMHGVDNTEACAWEIQHYESQCILCSGSKANGICHKLDSKHLKSMKYSS